MPVTDDVDDERFHDGLPSLPSAAAGLASTSCGTATNSRLGNSLQPLSIPSPAPAAPGVQWGMSELGSAMSGAGDTSRTTGTATFCTGDGGGTSSTPFGESPDASAVRHSALLSGKALRILAYYAIMHCIRLPVCFCMHRCAQRV